MPINPFIFIIIENGNICEYVHQDRKLQETNSEFVNSRFGVPSDEKDNV